MGPVIQTDPIKKAVIDYFNRGTMAADVWEEGYHEDKFDLCIEGADETGKGYKTFLIGTINVKFDILHDGSAEVRKVSFDVDNSDIEDFIVEQNKPSKRHV